MVSPNPQPLKEFKNLLCYQGRNLDFAKGGLENEIFCDVILMTYYQLRNVMTSPK